MFIDTTGDRWFAGKLANKPYAGFTSAQNVHGGQEATLLALYNSVHPWWPRPRPSSSGDPRLAIDTSSVGERGYARPLDGVDRFLAAEEQRPAIGG